MLSVDIFGSVVSTRSSEFETLSRFSRSILLALNSSSRAYERLK